jgi:plastocyanin domain-containing protein
MSLRVVVAGLALALGLSACKKEEPAAPAPRPSPTATTAPAAGGTAGTATADGVRKVPIEVVEAGYSPDRIPGKPGEKLSLVFTRKVDGSCYEQLKTPDGKLVDLPKGKPVEIPVTVPQDGEVKFACGMGMITGVVVAEKS